MDHLDFQQLTEAERISTYGAFFAMAVADGSLDDDEIVNIFECLDLDGLSDDAIHTVRTYLIDPPSLDQALAPLSESDNDVRYGVLVHLMDVALADAIYAAGERQAIARAASILGATVEQTEAIEAFIREVRGIDRPDVDETEAASRLKSAHSKLGKAGIPARSALFSGSLAGISAGGVGAAVVAGLGLAAAPAIGVAVASGGAAFFAMNLLLGKRDYRDPEARADTERVIGHLQEAIRETRRQLAETEAQGGGTRQEALDRRDRARHLSNRAMGMQRLLARKRAEQA